MKYHKSGNYNYIIYKLCTLYDIMYILDDIM